MFHHVALFRWQPGTPTEHVAAVKSALEAFSTTLSGLRSYACGPSLGLSDTNFDFGVVAVFEDKAAWDAYMAEPEHDRIRAELIAPYVGERASIQLDT